jgi:hypothetical protein
VWKFESDSTLADALSGNLGQWPEDIEEIMLGRVDESQPVEKREASVSTQATHDCQLSDYVVLLALHLLQLHDQQTKHEGVHEDLMCACGVFKSNQTGPTNNKKESCNPGLGPHKVPGCLLYHTASGVIASGMRVITQ